MEQLIVAVKRFSALNFFNEENLNIKLIKRDWKTESPSVNIFATNSFPSLMDRKYY